MAKSKPRSAKRPGAPAKAGVQAPAIPRSRWQGPLVVGFCFAFGYGITQRLMALRLPAFVQLGQGFELRSFPGTSLQSLRLKFGAEAEPVGSQLEQPQAPNAAPEAAEPAVEAPAASDTAPQAEPKSANLGPADGQAPPAPQLPPPASVPSSPTAPASKP